MRFTPRIIAVSGAVLGVALALPSFATNRTSEPPAPNAAARYAQADTGNSGADTTSPGNATTPSNVDDATLKRTAAAYVKVRDIAVKEQQAINNTDDSARKEQLAAESESAKLQAVKQAGMEPQEYNAVLQMVQADQGLQQKFLSYVHQVSQAS